MTEQQQYRRALAMTPAEVDAFLAAARTCRVGTVSRQGQPHVSPLWYAWDGTSLWLYSIVRSRRWKDLERDPRVSVMVDDGDDYGSLRGVELIGPVEPVGECPRHGGPDEVLAPPERLFAERYSGGRVIHDGRHAWLRLTPTKIVSWDFRKLPPEARQAVRR